MMKKISGKIRMGITLLKNIKNWPRVFLNYFEITHDEYLSFRFRNNEEVKIRNIENKNDTSGLAMIWEIFIRKNYNPKGFEIKEEDIVIDIGANIGIFSLYASHRAKKGKVYPMNHFQHTTKEYWII